MNAQARAAFRADAGVQGARAAFKALWWSAAALAGRAVVRPERDAPAVRSEAPPASQGAVWAAWLEAFTKDYEDVRAGLYPPSQALFASAGEALRSADDFLKDAREVAARRLRQGGVEVRDEAPSDAYPVYYRQNFHYQTGGWFTRDSARRYEPQVEALFAGTAGAMRRRALSLLAKAWRGRDQRGLKVADIACGSGAFLRDLKAAFPRAAVFGLDLSPAYAAEAASRSGAAVVQGLAEKLPFADASLDGATCIYLFHELPPRLRPVIAAELARVLKPGAVLAFADSIQPADAPDFTRMLDSFPVFFHEPYYASWRETDVEGLFAGAGLRRVDEDQAFLTKARLFMKG
jgi:ubiquinone/menaquinone biosynthesis C-methylase UbiE